MQKVIAVFAYIVDCSDDVDLANRKLDKVARAIHECSERCFGKDGSVVTPPTSSYAWPDLERCNVHRCEKCGRLGTASNKGHVVFGMLEGKLNGEAFLCDECLVAPSLMDDEEKAAGSAGRD